MVDPDMVKKKKHGSWAMAFSNIFLYNSDAFMEGRRDHLRKDPCTSTTLLSTSSLHSPPPPPPTSPSDEHPLVGHPDNSNMVISQSSSNLYPISSHSSLPIGSQNTSSSSSSHAIGSPSTTVPQSSLLIGQLAKPRVSDYMLADNSTRKVRPGRQLHFVEEYTQVPTGWPISNRK